MLPPGNGMPTLRVAPFVVIGTPDTRAVIDGETLGGKISEAFALFDIVNVMAAAPPSARVGAARLRSPTTGSTARWSIAATEPSICASS